jgi:hypothetical protein
MIFMLLGASNNSLKPLFNYGYTLLYLVSQNIDKIDLTLYFRKISILWSGHVALLVQKVNVLSLRSSASH